MLTPDLKAKILAKLNDPDLENCGIVTKTGRVVAFQNKAQWEVGEDHEVDANPCAHKFLLDPEKWARWESKAIAIWHTHCLDCQPARLSHGDIAQAKQLNLPYILFHTCFEEWDYFDPQDSHPFPLQKPLEFNPTEPTHWAGLPFEYGRSDCYTLFRAWYKEALGLELKDYPRGANMDERFQEGWNLFLESYEAEGFMGIEPKRAWSPAQGNPADLQTNDVLLISIGNATVPVHCAIVIGDPSKMQILHHPGGMGQLSAVDPLRQYWRDHTLLILRHRSQISSADLAGVASVSPVMDSPASVQPVTVQPVTVQPVTVPPAKQPDMNLSELEELAE